MADTKVEFSQLSKLYSEAKLKYPYLAYDIEQLHETEQKYMNIVCKYKI